MMMDIICVCEDVSPSFSPNVQPPPSGSVSLSPASVSPPPLSVETLPPLSDTYRIVVFKISEDFLSSFITCEFICTLYLTCFCNLSASSLSF